MKKKSLFPADFLWGASTAAHQVEGNNYNQWTVWELAHAKQQANSAKARLSWLPSWPDIEKQAQDPNNYVSGPGVDHYGRYEKDFEYIKALNLNAFRFGVEWSRIEPEEGEWNEKELKHYRNYIKELQNQGIEPLLNIWHWTVPVWFSEKGGFAKAGNLRYWARFVEKIAVDLDLAQLNYIVTLNEPNVYVGRSYIEGAWPPQERNVLKATWVYINLVRAHKIAYRILKKIDPSLQIGIAAQLANIQAKRPHHILDQIATKWMRFIWNWWFLNRIRHYQDFVGFNYYFTDYYSSFWRHSPDVPRNDLGWYMEPEGLYPITLRVWAHYKKPVIVTENGVADMHDQHREWWLAETIIAMERALSEGVELVGYFHWSLLDNFEWADGWWPKFGLISVDREHDMKRHVRPSAKWLAKKLAEIRDLPD